MKIKLTGVPVADQLKALKFYTEKLGFVEKHNIDLGGGHLWLTLVSPEEQDGTELLLEPAINHFEPAKVYYKALYDAGIPCAQFNVDDMDAEYKRLTALGVKFKSEPKNVGMAIAATIDDTCGNYIQLVQVL